MELLELSKKLRREVKKAGMDLEKQIKPINSQLRLERGAVTGGVKEKRAVNENGLNTFLSLVSSEANYTVGDVTTEKDLSNVVLTVSTEYIKSKSNITFNIAMVKGKILLETINFTDVKTEEVSTVTLKDIKESLKTVKVEA